ncbi:TadA family conjugal transfer-associated ATPase [Pseudactinotalea sp. HY158]|uniref:TadA family conjugal transfer-associated ATPase n=1 Tax=Pseudactinotalea sp. HY158 TaxID=2654547 RepID=UPI001E397725|nr:TadA family conjugal transfer-associated ATPase [Pseudactinotalea sp. HY158]
MSPPQGPRELEGIRERLVSAGGSLTGAVRAAPARSDAATWGLLRDAAAEIHGAGRIVQPLLDDPAVTDVLVNGEAAIWVDRGRGLERTGTRIEDARGFAVRLATLAGQRLDEAAPIVDGRLPDGTRLHAVLPPLVDGGVHISLRTGNRRARRWQDLIAAGFLHPRLAEIVDRLRSRRANMLVSGAAGVGKTTLVAAVLSRVPSSERIVIIEEAAELAPDHPHVVHLQGRPPNVQGAGAVALADLVRAAMRMRPDRLVLGECRGAEVREVLSALNTGHDGGLATVHANAATDVPARLLALGALAGMEAAAVAAQATAAIDALVHLRRDSSGRRYLDHVATFTADFRAERAVTVTAAGLRYGPGWQALAARLDGVDVGAGHRADGGVDGGADDAGVAPAPGGG